MIYKAALWAALKLAVVAFLAGLFTGIELLKFLIERGKTKYVKRGRDSE